MMKEILRKIIEQQEIRIGVFICNLGINIK